ncbi:hypothetical protein MXD81_27490, partial [Microbacteriaceae bacterium K1510]|nr:hypothetical protein [Microbacteriaceae bacterium K1510]
MPLLTALQQHNLPFSSHFLEDEISGSDDEWLQEFSRQKMGTQLCLAGRDETVARLRKLADQSGFREEEIQT